MQCGVESSSYVARERHGPRVAKNFDRFPCLIHDHRAVFAVRQVAFKFLRDGKFELSVDVIRDLADDAFAVQFSAPKRKYRFSFSLSFSLALSSRDFTAESEMPKASAVS